MKDQKLIDNAMSKRPTVNVKAMGTVAALSIVNLILTPLLFALMGGGAFRFQAFLIYIPTIVFAVFMFYLPQNRAVYLTIPVALLFVCFTVGILMQSGCDGWFKCFGIIMALTVAAVFVLRLCGVLKYQFIAVSAPAAMSAFCLLYAIFNLLTTIYRGISGWNQNVTAGGQTVVGGLISGESTLDTLTLDFGVIAYLIPIAILFLEVSFASFLLDDAKKN